MYSRIRPPRADAGKAARTDPHPAAAAGGVPDAAAPAVPRTRRRSSRRDPSARCRPPTAAPASTPASRYSLGGLGGPSGPQRGSAGYHTGSSSHGSTAPNDLSALVNANLALAQQNLAMAGQATGGDGRYIRPGLNSHADPSGMHPGEGCNRARFRGYTTPSANAPPRIPFLGTSFGVAGSFGIGAFGHDYPVVNPGEWRRVPDGLVAAADGHGARPRRGQRSRRRARQDGELARERRRGVWLHEGSRLPGWLARPRRRRHPRSWIAGARVVAARQLWRSSELPPEAQRRQRRGMEADCR